MEKLQEAATAPNIRHPEHPDPLQRAVTAQRRRLPAAAQRNIAQEANIPDIKRKYQAVHRRRARLIRTMFIVTRTPRASQMISGRSSMIMKMTTMMRMRPMMLQRIIGTIIIKSMIREK